MTVEQLISTVYTKNGYIVKFEEDSDEFPTILKFGSKNSLKKYAPDFLPKEVSHSSLYNESLVIYLKY